ncbi:hypothetical protein HNQ36_000095 [Afipia massiliensis]|uniref:Uncharacterized protein n=1 Tax=Afipia massiliensis TaxID=211460 RepID=A0A840MVG8_9BRAD|nr:hypothetical protein [Afipia massiliensis]MBB5050147.1 hypothetical protein [Afipia massiliensis]
MNNFYHVSFIFPGVPKMRDLEPAFSDTGDDWIRVSPHLWMVYSDKTVWDLYLKIRPLIDTQDSFFVSNFNTTAAAGLLPEWVWTWINTKSPGAVTTWSLGSEPQKQLR